MRGEKRHIQHHGRGEGRGTQTTKGKRDEKRLMNHTLGWPRGRKTYTDHKGKEG